MRIATYLAIVSLLMLIPFLAMLWALCSLGAAGRKPAWWGMMGAVLTPTILLETSLVTWAIPRGGTFPALNRLLSMTDDLIGASVVVFGLCFLRYAFHLAEALKEVRELEGRCRLSQFPITAQPRVFRTLPDKR